MRVTKIIREYIEDRVNERYPMPEKVQTAAELAFEDLKERCKIFIKAEAEKFAKAYVEDFERIAYHNSTDLPEQKIASFCEGMCLSYRTLEFKAEKEYTEAKRRVRDKREKAVRDVCVQLELGATKADLDAILANLPD